MNYILKKILKKIRNKTVFNPGVPEVTTVKARPLTELGEEYRLNVVVPSLNPQFVFGGISTALKFFESLADELNIKRRIITSDHTTEERFLKSYKGYQLAGSDCNGTQDRQVVSFANRAGKTIPVGKNDLFIATAWWTAFTYDAVLKFQAEHYAMSAHPLLYFIQDYEPFFYPWSSRSALAESTYHMDNPTVAVFNSRQLRDYFKNNDYSFYKEMYFDPVLNAALQENLKSSEIKEKKKKIIVYGRPSVARNATEIVIEALKLWAKKEKDAASFELISAGEQFPPVKLGEGCVLKAVGKLDINEYANLMRDSYAGISLMVSPHPSYPPLEMATFGVKTITNTYANKDLSSFSSNIISIQNMTPEAISDALHAITKNYDPYNFKMDLNKAYVTTGDIFVKINTEIKNILAL